jgi:hypothetical protein
MPVIRALNEVTKDKDVVRVLVTGFGVGSSSNSAPNPSLNRIYSAFRRIRR